MKIVSTIGARLRLSYVMLLSLVLVLAFVGLNRLAHLRQALTAVSVEIALSQARVQSISTNAEVAARKLLVLIGAPRDARVDAYAAIDAANQRLDKAMRDLAQPDVSQGISPDVKAAFTQIERHLALYRARYSENVDLIEAGDVDRARQLLGADTEVALGALVAALNDYSAAERKAVSERTDELAELAARDSNIVLALCGAAMLIGLVLSVMVTRSIVGPLQVTRRGARRIAAGHYEHRIPNCSVDEVGQVGAALNQLAAAVSEREAARVLAAETETLTGFSRRPRFLREGQQLLAELNGASAVLVCMDLDRLKPINSLLGFEAGDSLLRTLASHLSEAVPKPSVLGRLSGGALVALIALTDESDALTVTNALHQALEHPAAWREQSIDISVTFGLAVYPSDGAGPQATELLLRRAEGAMYNAKRSRVRSLRFDPTWERARESHLNLLSDLRLAIDSDQLEQVLQPKVDARTGEVRGAEALVRWRHPTRGFVSPAEFIPFAENTGRIRDITRWMLRRALKNLARMESLQAPGCYLAVNISTLDLADDDLPNWLSQEIKTSGVDPQRLQLEVTESGLMAAGDGPIEVLKRLRSSGVKLAIDDFGTGQSSLAYLQRLPVDELKIDRSFVDRVDLDARRQYLLGAIVDLGHSLDLKVTAEGVETVQELAVLRRVGADLLQGYLVSKPLAEDAFSQWVPPALPGG